MQGACITPCSKGAELLKLKVQASLRDVLRSQHCSDDLALAAHGMVFRDENHWIEGLMELRFIGRAAKKSRINLLLFPATKEG